jgi:hypothetical protein
VKRRLFSSACAVALAFVAWTAPARADLVAWSYSWAPTPGTVGATTGNGSLTLSSESTQSVVGDSNVVATNLKSASTELAGSPATFVNAGYTLAMTLKDTLSGQSTALNFTGLFNGTLSSQSANVGNTFTGLTTQTALLGGNTYTVTIGPYSGPGIPSSGNLGAISATVTVKAGDSTGVPSSVPEPSAMILAGLGCSGLLLARYRRRRKAAQPA